MKKSAAAGASRMSDSSRKPENTRKGGAIAEYIEALKASEKLAPQITSHTILPPRAAEYGQTARPWPRAMDGVFEQIGIPSLYSHQARAVDALRAGKNVVVSTPTASGKSLIYSLPVIERCLHDPDARSLFLFPLKALAQDQLASFRAMTAHWPEDARPQAAVYDGDTTPHFRRKIRENPPQVILTNPEMLHLAMLPHHQLWATLFAGLSLVVVDEVHTYRGVLGSHMAQVFRRLQRVAAHYGAKPNFAFCSATVGNPAELATLLTGTEPEPVLESGAPQGKRHYVFMNPQESPASVAIKLLKSALARNLRTIVYCQSRRMTELVSLWASEQSGEHAGKISAYRAGFLPEEGREIERKMSSGELLAVISTSALELGIDIGNLDLCILVGYPGTVMATLQRGGRVGRSSQESAVVLIAGEDALDQYIIRNSKDFFNRPAEKAVLNPENPVILQRHLECAASELPLRPARQPDAAWMTPAVLESVEALERQGILLRTAEGDEILASRKRPQRHVSLRGSGSSVSIETAEGELIGVADAARAMREAHPGSIYLHLGKHYEVVELDLPGGRALARPFRPSWYTRTRSHKDTDILSVDAERPVGGMAVRLGRLRITDTITGYEKRATKNSQLLGVVPLEFPPQVFETEGFWFEVPRNAQERIEELRMHFMGAIHALEHAAIGILPVMVMSDRNDFGGISTPMHLQTGRPSVFIYDGMPGGAGLSRSGFEQAPELFRHVLSVMRDCGCELGCPSCVHSPKCGSGNRPIDKEGALRLLEMILEDSAINREQAAKMLAAKPSGLEQTMGVATTSSGALYLRPENDHPTHRSGASATHSGRDNPAAQAGSLTSQNNSRQPEPDRVASGPRGFGLLPDGSSAGGPLAGTKNFSSSPNPDSRMHGGSPAGASGIGSFIPPVDSPVAFARPKVDLSNIPAGQALTFRVKGASSAGSSAPTGRIGNADMGYSIQTNAPGLSPEPASNRAAGRNMADAAWSAAGSEARVWQEFSDEPPPDFDVSLQNLNTVSHASGNMPTFAKAPPVAPENMGEPEGESAARQILRGLGLEHGAGLNLRNTYPAGSGRSARLTEPASAFRGAVHVEAPQGPPLDLHGHFAVLDVETRYSAAEVGGWNKAWKMGVSVAVLYDSRSGSFNAYGQDDIPALALALSEVPLVVGFNITRFDYAVLEPHAPGFHFRALPTLDMLSKVHEQLSYRLSLDNIARATLGCPKGADGLLALQWWKEGRVDEIREYCQKDVELTRDLFLHGREHGYLLFRNKAGQRVRVRADWQRPNPQ